jgi:hypothetical protein
VFVEPCDENARGECHLGCHGSAWAYPVSVDT